MNGARAFGAWIAIAVSIATACGPKHISSPVRPGQDVIVLLQDSDTKSTGAAGVSNPLGSVDLAAERDAALVSSGRAPVLTKLSPADVQRMFGDALSALPPAPRRFTLFFRFESDELTDQSQALIPQILGVVKEHAVQDVIVVGHTDTMGAHKANFELGLKRADTVRGLLIEAGLAESTVEVTSHGEGDLLIQTGNGKAEPRNRRVEIAVR